MIKLSWPLANVGVKPGIFISQTYYQNFNDYAQFGLDKHGGIDIAAPKGTPVYAAADGWIVERLSKDSGFGLRISQRVELPDKVLILVYGHFSAVVGNEEIVWNFNRKDRFVKEGDLIGYVGSTGFSTGNHLHLGVYEYDYNGNKLQPGNGASGAVDPYPLLKIRVPKFVGYKKDKQKDLMLPLPDMDTYNKLVNGEIQIKDVYQVGTLEMTWPIDKPLFKN